MKYIRYTSCITDFIEENTAIGNHQNVQSEAIEVCNSYINYEWN